MANDQDFINLGRACANVCQALCQRLKGRQLDELNQFVLDAIAELTTWVEQQCETG